MAIWMYAFLLMNFIVFSTHHMHDWMMQSTSCASLLPDFFAFFCRYAMMARIVLMMAMMSAPNAAEPAW